MHLRNSLQIGVNNLKNSINNGINIKIQIDDDTQQPKLVILNLKENLSKIREILEQNYKIPMNELSFAKKFKLYYNNTKSYMLAEIVKGDEEKKLLEEIIETNSNILHLKKYVSCTIITHDKYMAEIVSEKCQNEIVEADNDSQEDVDITVQVNDPPSQPLAIIYLNLKDKLSNIREKLKHNVIIEMDDTFSFAGKRRDNSRTKNYALAEIAREEEEKRILKDIIVEKSKFLYLIKHSKLNKSNISEEITDANTGVVDIIVQIDDPPSHALVRLNLEDKLSDIRETLKNNKLVEMDDTLLFAKKDSQDYALIARKDEEERIIKEIVGAGNKIYLRPNPKPDWEFLNKERKLEFGRTIIHDEFKVAKRRAFEMKNCAPEFGSEGCREKIIETGTDDDLMMKTNLFLTGNADFAKFGISTGSSNIINFNFTTNSHYNISEYSKVTLKLTLEPTMELIEAVKEVLDSGNPRNFKKITEEFGQFISTEVTLGGRICFKESSTLIKCPKEKSNEDTINSDALNSEETSEHSNRNVNYSKYKYFKLVGGGKQFKDFNEICWAKTLENFRNWDCIKFKDPASIFILLPDDLRKQVLSLVGQKILYASIKDHVYELSEPGKYGTFNLYNDNTPENILEIFRNKEAECSIFATVIDTNKVKKDAFNCQILSPPNEDPRLIIHCIQKKFRERKCKLKIRWMIIGYDINFNFNHSNYFNVRLKVQSNEVNQQTPTINLKYSDTPCIGIPVLSNLDSSNNSLAIGHHFFSNQENGEIGYRTYSYCLKNNHYVDLPNFTFYTLIILNHPKTELLSFKRCNMSNNTIRNMFVKSKPKYVSLYSTGENNCCSVFLKQKIKEIRIKYNDINCGQDNCNCKNKSSEKNLKYASFAPKKRDIVMN